MCYNLYSVFHDKVFRASINTHCGQRFSFPLHGTSSRVSVHFIFLLHDLRVLSSISIVHVRGKIKRILNAQSANSTVSSFVDS